MAVCAGIKRSGGRCTVSVEAGQTYCHHHDPARQGERRRAASKAGKSKPSRELAGVKTQLQALADRVLAGEVHRADAAVCGQLLNAKLRVVEIERKVKETEELEERLAALERAQGEARRWG